MSEESNIDYATLGKGLIDLIEKSRKPQAEAKQNEADDTAIEHDHKHRTPERKPLNSLYEENGRIYDTSGRKYVPLDPKEIGQVFETADRIWHPTTMDWENCPECKTDFIEREKKKGYEWTLKKTGK